LILQERRRAMGTIRIFFMLAVAVTGLAQTLPALAQDQKHDWKLSEILGWYDLLGGDTSVNVELHMEKDAITDFIGSPPTWIKNRGRFEKINRNQFVLIPIELTNEKGSDFLNYNMNYRNWPAFIRIEMTELHRLAPGKRSVIRLCYFLSLAEAHTRENRCLGSAYRPIGPRHEKPESN
jgi:hypothetical protein